MQPRSIVMGLLTAAIVLFTSDHHTSQAQQSQAAAPAPISQPAPASQTATTKSVDVKKPAPATATKKQEAKPQQAQAKPVAKPATKPEKEPNKQPKFVQYKIKSGDTLFEIATTYNTTTDLIQQHNPQLNPEELKIGQVLKVPVDTVKKQKTRQELAQTAGKMVLSSSGEPSNYIRKLPCMLTAYTNSYESTGKYPSDPGYGITASGQVAKEGLTIAVDPNIIPMHSVVYIPGVGVRYAEDTGGAIKGNHIDVFYNDDSFAHDFGVKEDVNVYILEEGNREST